MRLHIPVVAALAVLGAGWCAAADSSTSPDNGQTTTSTDGQLAPQTFVDQAASAGMLEVQSSQLALSKGVDQKVRDFAQHMIDDHQKANDELKQLAERKGWTVKSTLAPDDQKQLDKLQGYTGADFGRQYIKMQAKAHDDAVSLFDRGSRDLQDPDLKQFAQKYLPTLQEHQRMANDLKSQEKTSKAEGSGQGGSQSGTVGSDSWSSQSSAPGGASGSSSQGSSNGSLGSGDSTSSNGSLGSGDSTTIDSGIHGSANTPDSSGSQSPSNGQQQNSGGQQSGSNGQQSGSSSTYRDDSQQQSSAGSGVGGSSQNQGTMYQDQQKSGSGY